MTGQLRHEMGERGGMSCSKGPQVGIEPAAAAAAARSDPLYMRPTLYALSRRQSSSNNLIYFLNFGSKSEFGYYDSISRECTVGEG